jgi:hypothetical protein
VETGCRGGQGSPRAAAPRKKKKKMYTSSNITILRPKRKCNIRAWVVSLGILMKEFGGEERTEGQVGTKTLVRR